MSRRANLQHTQATVRLLTPDPGPGQGQVFQHFGFERGATGLVRRKLLVYVPPGYSLRRRYPVIYCLDGQNVFDLPEAREGGWKLDRALERLIRQQAVPPAILVGVCHSRYRMREYVGWSQEPGHYHSNGDLHARYLVDTVKPFVESTYRTRSRLRAHSLVGASAGGVAALYTAWAHPGAFASVACMSAGRHYFRELLRRFDDQSPTFRLFLSCGDRGMDRAFRRATMVFYRAMRARGIQVGKRLHKGDHSERTWSRVAPWLLRFLLS